MVFPLLVVIFNVATQDKQGAVEGRQQNVLVVIGANGHIVGQVYCLLTQQGSTTQFHQNEDAPQLIEIINTVLQVFPTLTIFLKALKAGFCLFDGLFDFAFDQIKRLRFRRQRRLNHKRFLLLCGDYRILFVN